MKDQIRNKKSNQCEQYACNRCLAISSILNTLQNKLNLIILFRPKKQNKKENSLNESSSNIYKTKYDCRHSFNNKIERENIQRFTVSHGLKALIKVTMSHDMWENKTMQVI